MVNYSCTWQQGNIELAGSLPKNEGLDKKGATLNLGKPGGLFELQGRCEWYIMITPLLRNHN